MRLRLRPAAFFLLCASAVPACADENDAPALKLDRAFSRVTKEHAGETPGAPPTFISAQRVEGKNDGQIEAFGKAELHRPGQTVYADHMLYLQSTQDVSATGHVRMEENNDVILSPSLTYNLDTGVGDIPQPEFTLGDTHARGTASNLHLEEKKNVHTLQNVTYTTCPAGEDDWLLKVSNLEIDRNTQIGTAHNAHVEFMGAPILYTPWMDFALNGQRKSGFLSPVFGTTVKGGSDLTLPFYWNIAPNYDATLAPRIMTRRGILLNNEFRYLQPGYSGEVHADIMPVDRLTNRNRSHFSLSHSQDFGHGLGGYLNLNRVSDEAYFRDLSDVVSTTSQTNLVREGALTYSEDWWNAVARVQSYHVLQDPAAPISAPYSRLPQISVSAQRPLWEQEASTTTGQPAANPTVSFTGEYVDFRHPTLLNGARLVLYPSVSYPLVSQPAYYVTPKIGLHNTHYAMGDNNTSSIPNISRTVPIFSLDSGVAFERDWGVSGQKFIQTLEPRAYYVRIPYHNQDQLPVFDSAQAGFDFSQIFSENRFYGNDRIGDANQLTLGLTSRLLEPDNGTERLRATIAQRFSAITPRVNLVTPTSTTNKSDILLAATGQVTRAWSLDSALQYNPNQSRTEQFNTSVRYQPEIGKILNMGYRFTRQSLEQMDLSTQWLLAGRWHAVARWNYSIPDKRDLETMLGLEYNQSCWTVRLVAQRFPTATQQYSTSFFVQLELNDLVAVGSDPLAVLRQSIPGYTKLNDTPHN